MRTYIITGASGFVGCNLVRQLNATQNDNVSIRALVSPRYQGGSLDGLNCRLFVSDITKPESLLKAFDVSPQEVTDGLFVIHCAGLIDIGSRPNPALYQVNVEGTKHVIAVTRQLGERLGIKPRFVHVGSVHVIPEAPEGKQMSEPTRFDPDAVIGQYAKSKAQAAHYVLDRFATGALEGCIVLPSGIIGPFNYGSDDMKQLMVKVATGRLSVCVRGAYDFVDVRDVCNGIIQACERGRNGESYILSNRSVSIKEICDDVCAFVGRSPLKVVLPIGFAKLFAPMSEFVDRLRKKAPLFTPYALHTLQSNSNFSHKKASEELGYTTRPIEETVFDTMAWFETQ